VTDEFKCRNCGECCMAFEIGPLEDDEGVNFRTYFDKDGWEYLEKRRPAWSPDWAKMGVCVYLGSRSSSRLAGTDLNNKLASSSDSVKSTDNKKHYCTIYDKRPLVCQEFTCEDGDEDLRRAKRRCSDPGTWSAEAFRLFFWKTLREKERQRRS
jgi:Fe-S-cluster containining protein